MNLWEKCAWKLPRKLAYWAFIRVAAEASQKLALKEMGNITVLDAVHIWDVQAQPKP